ncbi:hypothetical protein [Bradyrhizobium sp. SYSU BS000235]|uniref:hypothetical protein n=1 Tax=Bradyrhizobium sp. SYSU BS000235 TaxID=3411332 RepID=UPI003C713AAF
MKARHKIIKKGKAHFEQFISGRTASSEDPLPLTHITDAYDLRDIIKDRQIAPRLCNVFDYDLSYYFYGRPAYRKNGDTQANSLAAYAPIVLIFKPTISDDAIAAFPFDTGAFKGEKYSDVTHHRMSVEDFGLEPSHENIGKIVAFFFGNNKNYYDQLPSQKTKIGKNEFEAQSYQELITYRGKNERDDRSTTIEIIFDKSVELRTNLLAIVVPSSFLKDKAVKSRLQALHVHIRPYTDGANLTPASQIPRLSDVVRHYYIEQGILKK